MAIGAFCLFTRKRRACSQYSDRFHTRTALLALACVLVLFFPVISASDDLHPTQAVLEDATKRIQHVMRRHQHGARRSLHPMLPALLAIQLFVRADGVASDGSRRA